jgi:hypothetical protein
MRVLDEVAEAIQAARGRLPQPVVSHFGLCEQFGEPLTPREWNRIQRSLGCSLPALWFDQGHWFLPEGFATIWDLVEHAARRHPEWEPPTERSVTAWREAQVFVGVRVVIVDAGAVDREVVVRSARLGRDLGLE